MFTFSIGPQSFIHNSKTQKALKTQVFQRVAANFLTKSYLNQWRAMFTTFMWIFAIWTGHASLHLIIEYCSRPWCVHKLHNGNTQNNLASRVSEKRFTIISMNLNFPLLMPKAFVFFLLAEKQWLGTQIKDSSGFKIFIFCLLAWASYLITLNFYNMRKKNLHLMRLL